MESLFHSLVASSVLGGSAGVSLTSIGGRGVAGESLLAEHGVAIVEEEHGVTGALDRGDLGGLRALAGGAVREPAWVLKYILAFGFWLKMLCHNVHSNHGGSFYPFQLSEGT